MLPEVYAGALFQSNFKWLMQWSSLLHLPWERALWSDILTGRKCFLILGWRFYCARFNPLFLFASTEDIQNHFSSYSGFDSPKTGNDRLSPWFFPPCILSCNYFSLTKLFLNSVCILRTLAYTLVLFFHVIFFFTLVFLAPKKKFGVNYQHVTSLQLLQSVLTVVSPPASLL